MDYPTETVFLERHFEMSFFHTNKIYSYGVGMEEEMRDSK